MNSIIYKLMKKNNNTITVIGIAGGEEYKITNIDEKKSLLSLSGIKWNGKRTMPFADIDNFSIDSLKQVYPEYFI